MDIKIYVAYLYVRDYITSLQLLYVTTTDRIVTLGLFHFIGSANGYTDSYTTHSHCYYQAWLTGLLF